MSIIRKHYVQLSNFIDAVCLDKNVRGTTFVRDTSPAVTLIACDLGHCSLLNQT